MEPDLDALIRRADTADSGAADQLFALLYHELHRVAERNLRRANGAATLGTTTLLHETYLNIASRHDATFTDQARFLGYASRAMRGLVIDYARRSRALKRGRQFEITLASELAPCDATSQQPQELERLGDAIAELATLDPALAQLVTCTSSAASRSPRSQRCAACRSVPSSATGARRACCCSIR